jgi:hypothetical protein
MPNNIQLDKFAETLFQHPFRDGVFRPSTARYAHTPAEFLKEFAEHYVMCVSSSRVRRGRTLPTGKIIKYDLLATSLPPDLGDL